MVSVNFNNNLKVYQMGGVNKVETAPFPAQTNPVQQPTQEQARPMFKSQPYTSALTVKTELVSSEDKKKYNAISKELDGKY